MEMEAPADARLDLGLGLPPARNPRRRGQRVPDRYGRMTQDSLESQDLPVAIRGEAAIARRLRAEPRSILIA